MTDFAAHHFLGQAVLRDAVHQHSSRFRLQFENFDSKTGTGKVTGDSNSCRARAYYGNAAASFGCHFLVGQVGLSVKIRNKALKLSNIDVLAALIQDAGALTLPFVTANTAADRRQIALRANYMDGIAKIAFTQFVNPVGNIVVDGTALLALRYLAPEAALGLLYGFCEGVAFVYFSKTFHFF